MPKLMPYPFASAMALGAWPFAGLRLRILRQFQAFLASGALAVRASGYRFCGVALRCVASLRLRCAFSGIALVGKAECFLLALGPSPSLQRIGFAAR